MRYYRELGVSVEKLSGRISKWQWAGPRTNNCVFLYGTNRMTQCRTTRWTEDILRVGLAMEFSDDAEACRDWAYFGLAYFRTVYIRTYGWWLEAKLILRRTLLFRDKLRVRLDSQFKRYVSNHCP